MDTTLDRWARRGLWLLPVYGLLTLVATITHQPDPAVDFTAWSEYVTTPWFYVRHILFSSLGMAVGQLGFIALAVLLVRTSRPRLAVGAVAMQLLGGSIVFGLFGVAAFVQPTIGAAHLAGNAAASGWYDAVFDAPATLVPALVGALAFAVSSMLLAAALATHRELPRWVPWAFGASGALIGFLGIIVGALQTVGSLALIASSIVVIRALDPTPRAAQAVPGAVVAPIGPPG